MSSLIVTIDGPAGSGKSTVGRLLAERLGACFLDTGAMYRAVTLAAMQAGLDLRDTDSLLEMMNNTLFEFAPGQEQFSAFIDGRDFSEMIRRPEVTANTHYVASAPQLRKKLVEMQRKFAEAHKKIVTEGRDQGTVAFPDADVKIYLQAETAERARRRKAQLDQAGIAQPVEAVERDIIARDNSDTGRSNSPLKPADDAITVDTTGLDIEQAVQKLYDLVKGRCSEKK